jgi:hypothetical protein
VDALAHVSADQARQCRERAHDDEHDDGEIDHDAMIGRWLPRDGVM